MDKVHIIPRACEFYSEDGSIKPGTETLLRLTKALSLTRMRRKEYRILLGAGTIPKSSPSVAAKTVMKDWLASCFTNNGLEMRFESDNSVLFTEEEKQVLIKTSQSNVWGTFREMESIMEAFGDTMGDDDPIIVVSSDYHIPRLRLIWWFLGKQVTFVSVPAEQTFRNKILEPLRYLKVLLLGIVYWCRNWSLEPRTAA